MVMIFKTMKKIDCYNFFVLINMSLIQFLNVREILHNSDILLINRKNINRNQLEKFRSLFNLLTRKQCVQHLTLTLILL
jgi:hypothetical protein